jgi:hypothetical protein
MSRRIVAVELVRFALEHGVVPGAASVSPDLTRGDDDRRRG